MTDETNWSDTGEEPLMFSRGEWEYIVGDAEEHEDEITERLAEKLITALQELDSVWHYFPEGALEQAFSSRSSSDNAAIRDTLLSMVALAYYGGQLNDDTVVGRISEAVRGAEAARGNHAEIDFAVRTSPMLTPEEVIQKLESGDDRGVSLKEYENVWYSTDISPERIADCESGIFSAESDDLLRDIRALRETNARQPRPPSTTIVDITTEDEATNIE